MTRRILVVDDEPEIRRLIERYLTREGFAVQTAADGREMAETLDRQPVDLVILDIRLPGEDGLSLTRRLSQTHDLAIILLTSRAEVIDRVAGLESGADDYLGKPFDLRELLARINAVLRRLEKSRAEPVGAAPAERYRFDGWILDTARRELRAANGRQAKLSPAQFDLLTVLARNPQQVLTRDFLTAKTCGRSLPSYDRRIDIRVGQLRKILGQSPEAGRPIRTVRGSGYLFDCEVVESR